MRLAAWRQVVSELRTALGKACDADAANLRAKQQRIRQKRKLWELQHPMRRQSSSSHDAPSLGAGTKPSQLSVTYPCRFALRSAASASHAFPDAVAVRSQKSTVSPSFPTPPCSR